MEQQVVKTIQKNQTGERPIQNQNGRPSEKQMTYIVSLSKTVGVKINISEVADKKAASQLIEKLLKMQTKKSGSSVDKFSAKKAVFDFATDLIFSKYCRFENDPTKYADDFWVDVAKFIKHYQANLKKYIYAEPKFISANNPQLRKG